MKAELSKIQHARSEKDFPEIDLEQDEYVVLHIKRSRLGVALIWAVVAVLVVALSLILIFFAKSNDMMNTVFNVNEASMHYLRVAVLALYVVFFFGGFVVQSIYDSNQIYVTNRRLIQKSRVSIFANSTNIIELRRIEDVSFRQNSLLDQIFHMGVLRMSTVGDETTYTLKYVDTPHDEVKTISHLVYECKKTNDDTSVK
ncbi:PH domain-containing protein [Candidatus Saccharibacteria bacterium]|nr:PH domain-containing protein [Candidatus Saccharibacteria bacterium]MBR3377972.1 PH domain-containing protein [Candidatus Saccharibacteria bacterium]